MSIERERERKSGRAREKERENGKALSVGDKKCNFLMCVRGGESGGGTCIKKKVSEKGSVV